MYYHYILFILFNYSDLYSFYLSAYYTYKILYYLLRKNKYKEQDWVIC